MRIRTGHGSEDWTRNEPGAPYSPRSYGGASGAVAIAEMKPVLSSNGGNFITSGPDKKRLVPSERGR